MSNTFDENFDEKIIFLQNDTQNKQPKSPLSQKGYPIKQTKNFNHKRQNRDEA